MLPAAACCYVNIHHYCLHRALHKEGGFLPSTTDKSSGHKWKFRRFCCVPSVLFFVLVLVNFPVSLTLLMAYQPRCNASVVYTFVALPTVVIVLSIPHVSKIIVSCFGSSNRALPGNDRAEPAVDPKSSRRSNGQDGDSVINEMCTALEAVDMTELYSTRIFVLVNGAAADVTLEAPGLVECVEALHTCFHRNPFISVLCVNHQSLLAALQRRFST